MRVVSELEARFESEPVGEVDLNDRLFSFSGNGRADQLRVAWEAANERWLVGQGSGTFEYLWYQNRKDILVVRDGHSLYAETLAEIGLIGLSLLVATLAVPLVGAVRARRFRYVPAAAAAYVAWLAASGLDWHWEMVGVTMTALLVGSVALLGAERRRRGRLRGGVRGVAIVASVALSALAVVSLVGNQALFAGREALAANDPRDCPGPRAPRAGPPVLVARTAHRARRRCGSERKTRSRSRGISRGNRDRPAELGGVAPLRSGRTRGRTPDGVRTRAGTQPPRARSTGW